MTWVHFSQEHFIMEKTRGCHFTKAGYGCKVTDIQLNLPMENEITPNF